MSAIEAGAVWVSGQLLSARDADRTVLAETIPSGVYETIRCYETPDGPAVFRIDEHVDHFVDAAKRYGIPIPFTPRELRAAVCQLVSANGLTNCFVRPAAFFAGRIETAIVAWPAPWRLATEETIFVVQNGVVATSGDPQLLTTVVRDTVLIVARDLGYEVASRPLDLRDVAGADEAFTIDSAAELRTLNPGPVTRAIQKTFAEATAGRDPKYRPWLHFVDDCMLAGAYNAATCI